MEARGPEVRGRSSVHSEFKALLGPVKPSIKDEGEERGGEGRGGRVDERGRGEGESMHSITEQWFGFSFPAALIHAAHTAACPGWSLALVRNSGREASLTKCRKKMKQKRRVRWKPEEHFSRV